MSDAYTQALEKLSASKKYAGVCPDTLARILTECFQRHKKPKDAEKAAREKLHGITGAFMSAEEHKRASAALVDCAKGDEAALIEVLSQHSSTRERLPLKAMDSLYAKIFEVTGKPEKILDLACGLNPIYLAARGHDVTGVDIQNQAIELVNRMGAENNLPVRGTCADLLIEGSIPQEHFSLALVFKLLPLLETQKTGAAAATLLAINADYTAVSFPTRTLTGRNVGMEANYTRWMEAHLPAEREVIARFVEANELVYILKAI